MHKKQMQRGDMKADYITINRSKTLSNLDIVDYY